MAAGPESVSAVLSDAGGAPPTHPSVCPHLRPVSSFTRGLYDSWSVGPEVSVYTSPQPGVVPDVKGFSDSVRHGSCRRRCRWVLTCDPQGETHHLSSSLFDPPPSPLLSPPPTVSSVLADDPEPSESMFYCSPPSSEERIIDSFSVAFSVA